jgi:hypothetical protein
LKLLRQTPPDPQQLALQLDFFSPQFSSQPTIDRPAPRHAPEPAIPPQKETPELFPSPGTPSSQSAPGTKRRVQVLDHILEYRLLRSRRRSIGFLIDDDGLRITAPKWVTVAEIDNAIREKQRWILTKLTERRERSARRLQPQMQWRDGATLPYLGIDLTLRILAAQAAGIAYHAERRELVVACRRMPASSS